MAGGTQETSPERAPRRKTWTFGPRFYNGESAQAAFLDRVSVMAIREGVDVDIIDVSGRFVEMISLEGAQQRLSPVELDRRIQDKQDTIGMATKEIQRLTDIRTQLYGESKKDDITTLSL